MKKALMILLCGLILGSINMEGQEITDSTVIQKIRQYNKESKAKLIYRKTKEISQRTVNYSDTVNYILSKGSLSTSTFGLAERMNNHYRGVGQRFNINETINILGATTIAFLDFDFSATAPSQNLGLYFTKVDPVTNLPGEVIDTFQISVEDIITPQTFNLDRTVTVSDDFFIVFEKDTASGKTFYITRTNDGDGQLELLLAHNNRGTWYNIADTSNNPTRKNMFDFDLNVGLITDQEIEARIIPPLNSCQNEPVKFINASKIDTTGMMNRIDTLNGNTSYFEWGFGNNQFSKEISPEYVYRQTGSYNVSLLARVKTWSGNRVVTDRTSIMITVNPSFSQDSIVQICVRDSILLKGAYRYENDIIRDTLTAMGGCDSIINYFVTNYPEQTNNLNFTLCEGDSIIVGGKYRKTAGTYLDTASNTNGCDSITVFRITVNPTTTIEETFFICENDSIMVRGKVYKTSTSFTDIVKDANNCNVIYETTTILADANNSVNAGFSAFARSNSAMVDYINFSTNATEYDWDFGDGNTSSLETPTHMFSDHTMKFETCLIARQRDPQNKLCNADTFCLSVLSLNELDSRFSEVSVFPIPTSSELTVSNLPTDCKDCEIQVYNLLGQRVLTKRISEQTEVLSFANQVNGVYLLTIVDKQKKGMNSFVKRIQISK